MSQENMNWIPEIMYMEEGEEESVAGQFPFIPVPQEQSMPDMLFIFEHRETGVYEPDQYGEEVPVVDYTLFSFANMNTLCEKLDPELYDKVRLALGLSTLKEAREKGRGIVAKSEVNEG